MTNSSKRKINPQFHFGTIPIYCMCPMIFSCASDLLFSILFADDTTVLIEGHEYQKLIETLNEEFVKLTKLQDNNLTLNIRKTRVVINTILFIEYK